MGVSPDQLPLLEKEMAKIKLELQVRVFETDNVFPMRVFVSTIIMFLTYTERNNVEAPRTTAFR